MKKREDSVRVSFNNRPGRQAKNGLKFFFFQFLLFVWNICPTDSFFISTVNESTVNIIIIKL
jgi:hypothetical protein